jgi:outer membrane protein OmpA-like peptidoglycan-associated protein
MVRLLFCLSVLSCLSAYCQVKRIPLKKQTYADIAYAMEIKDSVVGPMNVSIGYGKIREVNTDNETETNSVWFKFTMPKDTILTFDIVGLDSCDDYEFVLYKYSSPDFADRIRKKLLQPVRSCHWASLRCAPSIGLSTLVTDTTKKKARHYLPALPVKKGETYYLMVDYASLLTYSEDLIPGMHVKNPSGFMIYFYNYWPKKKDKKPVKDILFEVNKTNFTAVATKELDELSDYLKKNPAITIEIEGYADSSGTGTDNVKLSTQRAKTVYDYLLSKGIAASRMRYKGMGGLKSGDASRNRKVKIVLSE